MVSLIRSAAEDIFGDSHNGTEGRGRRSDAQLLSQRVLARPVQASQFFIHDYDAVGVLGVVIVERASAAQRDLQDAKIVGSGDDIVGSWNLAGGRIWILRCDKVLSSP